MENNTIARKKRKRIKYHLTDIIRRETYMSEMFANVQPAVGLFIMMIVFFIAVNVDIKTTQETLSDTAHYINEQCNSFTRHNLASETKSLMRVIESAQQINHNITYERRLSDKDIFTEEFIIQMDMAQMRLTNILTVLHLLMLLSILKKHMRQELTVKMVHMLTLQHVVCQMKVGLLLSIIILRQNMLIITTYHLHIYYQVMMTRKMERLLLQREIR